MTGLAAGEPAAPSRLECGAAAGGRERRWSHRFVRGPLRRETPHRLHTATGRRGEVGSAESGVLVGALHTVPLDQVGAVPGARAALAGNPARAGIGLRGATRWRDGVFSREAPDQAPACRCNPSPHAFATPGTRIPPDRSTCAGSRSSLTRTRRPSLRSRDRPQCQPLKRCAGLPANHPAVLSRRRSSWEARCSGSVAADPRRPPADFPIRSAPHPGGQPCTT